MPLHHQNSRILKGFGKGGLKIAGTGIISMFLSLKFDDFFNGISTKTNTERGIA